MLPIPELNNIISWQEPIWAEPNKPRGKPDKIGEQEITGRIVSIGDVFELQVIEIKKISHDAAIVKVKIGDLIRRKKTTIMQGHCRIIQAS